MLPDARYHTVRSRRVAKLRGRIGLALVACLSFLAGMTDAIGFTTTGDFVSFMSGNTTRLAVSLGQADYALAGSILALIGAFIVGNATGVIFARVVGQRAWPLLLFASGLLFGGTVAPSNFEALILAVISMGLINAVVEEVNGLPIGLTYVTGALSRFGRGLGRWVLGERRQGWRVQLIPWVGMLVGAAVGATLGASYSLNALAFSGLLSIGLCMVSVAIPHRWQRAFMQK